MRNNRAAPTLPDGLRIYAVGDIHGRADLLGRLADLIETDHRERPAAVVTTLFVGDYVDRGPASASVIDRLVRADFPTPLVTLRGNHEDILQRFLRGTVEFDYYAQLGGEATMQSYGVDLAELAWINPADQDDALRAAIPASHRQFLDDSRLSFSAGDYFFCHAGVRPGVPLELQSEEDLLWIREEFLSWSGDFGKFIIHGHTPAPAPEIRANRINVDTKAFASGVLTAVVLEGSRQRFLQARRTG